MSDKKKIYELILYIMLICLMVLHACVDNFNYKLLINIILIVVNVRLLFNSYNINLFRSLNLFLILCFWVIIMINTIIHG